MRRIWSLRNPTNFIITVLGTSSIGFYFFSMYKEDQFSSPIINQSVKVLSGNEKLRQLLGYPLSYKAALSNKRLDKHNEVYYSFKVVGPRATIDTEMNTSFMTTEQIKGNVEELELDLIKLSNSIQELKTAISKEKNRQDRNLMSLDLKAKESDIVNRKTKLEIEKQNQEKKIRKYYVPQGNLYNDIVAKKSPEELPADTKLWGINSMVVELPNRTKITIIDENINIQGKPRFAQEISDDGKIQPFTSQSIRRRIVSNLIINESEVAEYGRNKTNFMYQKYGSYRIIMMTAVLIGATIGVLAMSKNRHKSVANSVLIAEAQNMFLKNMKVKDLMRQKNIRQLNWNQKLIAGGMKGVFFDCQIDVEGIRAGKVILAGKYIQKDEKYTYDTFEFQFKDKSNDLVTISLLK